MRRITVGALLVLAAMVLALNANVALAKVWYPASVSDLIAAINKANSAGGSNTIVLATHETFTLTAVNNTADGPNGLPVITSNLTIQGQGAIIERSTAAGTPAFRVFDVAAGASLSLSDVTIANGLVTANRGMTASGGAIYVEPGGSLIASYTTFTDNQAVGGDGGRQAGGLGMGGAIQNEGAARFDHDTFSANQAKGGATRNPSGKALGGQGFGGAVGNGTLGRLTATQCLFVENRAVGGLREDPSEQFDSLAAGGAVCNWNVALFSECAFAGNECLGGPADNGVDGGYAGGGAIESGTRHTNNADLTLEHCTFTQNHTRGAVAGPGAGPTNFGGTAYGGALAVGYTWSTSRVTITDCQFTSNQAIGAVGPLGGWGQDGAITQESPPEGSDGVSTMVISRSTFTGNQAIGASVGGAGEAGAIGNTDWNTSDGSGAILAIWYCTFKGNEAIGAAGGDGLFDGAPAFAEAGAVDTSGNTIIAGSTFLNNRAVGGSLAPGATPNWNTASIGGALGSWGGTLDVDGCRFVGNQAIGASGGPDVSGSAALGGAIEVNNGLRASITNCLLSLNDAVGGNGGAHAPGGLGAGGGINVELVPYATATGPQTLLTLSASNLRDNQAVGGDGGSSANGGDGLGGGLSVGTGFFFGNEDTSSVTINGNSLIIGNEAIGGTGGNGADGGNGLGGGLYNLVTAALSECVVNANQAAGGAAGGNGSTGTGEGGGVYNDLLINPLASVLIDAATVIFGNKPDDRYGW